MEITFDSIIGILGLLLGGGTIGSIFTWRFQRKKAKAEATQAEVEAAKEKQEYYSEIAKNPIALMVKLLDRCCNVSGMAAGFSSEKLVDYINETEKWFYPMLQQGKTDYPQYNNQIFVLRYHISSVISSLKHMMHTEKCER